MPATTSELPPDSWSDPLYRARADLPADAEPLVLAGVEVGMTVTDTDPRSVEAQWSPDRAVTLSVGPAVSADQLAAVLPEFLEHAAGFADRPTDAVLVLPSRDVDRSRVAREAGLAPEAMLAVADLARDASGPAALADVEVRDAGPGDADAVLELWWKQARYETRLGTLRTTAAIHAALEAAVEERISGPGTTLVAVAEGHVIGLVDALTPESSAWAGVSTVLEPVSYLAVASTAAAHRGRGTAGALVAELHRRHRASGVAASVLHYSAYNPLSVPFWSQQGYRPLLTSFARTLRAGT